jgi:hypothetical protein
VRGNRAACRAGPVRKSAFVTVTHRVHSTLVRSATDRDTRDSPATWPTAKLTAVGVSGRHGHGALSRVAGASDLGTDGATRRRRLTADDIVPALPTTSTTATVNPAPSSLNGPSGRSGAAVRYRAAAVSDGDSVRVSILRSDRTRGPASDRDKRPSLVTINTVP